jgi:flagellar protein FlaG
MTFEIGRLTFQTPAAPPAPTRAPSGAPAAGEPAAVDTSTVIPASPPPEVLAEVDAAFERAHELASDNRELHFSTNQSSGRVVIQVRTLDGEVLRTIPPSEALDVMAGRAL